MGLDLNVDRCVIVIGTGLLALWNARHLFLLITDVPQSIVCSTIQSVSKVELV